MRQVACNFPWETGMKHLCRNETFMSKAEQIIFAWWRTHQRKIVLMDRNVWRARLGLGGPVILLHAAQIASDGHSSIHTMAPWESNGQASCWSGNRHCSICIKSFYSSTDCSRLVPWEFLRCRQLGRHKSSCHHFWNTVLWQIPCSASILLFKTLSLWLPWKGTQWIPRWLCFPHWGHPESESKVGDLAG